MKRLSIVVLALLSLTLGAVVVCAEEVQVGDWVVNTEGGHVNIFFKGVEVIKNDDFSFRLDSNNKEVPIVYSMNYPINETFKEKVEKKGAGKVITISKQDGGMDLKRVISIYPDKIIGDYTFTMQGQVGKFQNNAGFLWIPLETFINEDLSYSVLNGDNASEKTLSAKYNSPYLGAVGIDGVLWKNKGINFEIHLINPIGIIVGSDVSKTDGKPALWWLKDNRDDKDQHFSIALGYFFLNTGDVMNVGYEIRCSKAK